MKVCVNSPGFSYDVHSLVKAFYPEEDVDIIPYDDPGADLKVFVSCGDVGRSDTTSGYVEIENTRDISHGKVREDYLDLTRPLVKNLLKRNLYRVLAGISGRSLPWGTMTGIRPVKVPMKLIRDDTDDEQIIEYLKSVYYCSDDKARLALEIAHREKGIVDGLNDNGFSLYVGIPFCPTTCLYCSFTSYPIASWKERTDDYLRALKKELDFFAGYYRGRYVDSIYIGGGTPTTLTGEQLRDLTSYIRSHFDVSHLLEFTVEAGRPDSITAEKLEALKEAGVSRISINPQTMNDKTLRLIGRRHTVDDVYAAFDAARSAGFDNINTDLILGLPGEDETDVANTLACIGKLAPESVTVHSLAIKRAAGMHTFLEEHDDIKSRNSAEMMDMAAGFARSSGLLPYYLYRQKNMSGNFENTGYAKESCFGIYNIAIMEETTDIAAAGAGTISKRVFSGDRIERCDNVKDVALYIDRIDEMIEKKKKLFC